jgi:hypothetical protein
MVTHKSGHRIFKALRLEPCALCRLAIGYSINYQTNLFNDTGE